MTDRPQRAKDYDYRVLHRTGDRVEKKRTRGEINPEISEKDSKSDVENVEEVISADVEAITVDVEDSKSDVENVEELISADVEDFNEDVESDINEEFKAMADHIANLKSQEATISEDIDDFLDENIVKEIGNSVEDFDQAKRRIEELRTNYRGVHNQLKTAMDDQDYKTCYDIPFPAKIQVMKDYIKYLKVGRSALRECDDVKAKDKLDVQSVQFKFLSNEIQLVINRLDSVFNLDDDAWKAETDEKITKRRSDVTEQVKEVQTLATSIKDMIGSAAGVDGAFPVITEKQKL